MEEKRRRKKMNKPMSSTENNTLDIYAFIVSSVFIITRDPLPILMQVLLVWDLRPAGWDSRMFCGFRSLWIMPLACSTLIAPAICCKNTRMVSSLSVPLAVYVRKETQQLLPNLFFVFF